MSVQALDATALAYDYSVPVLDPLAREAKRCFQNQAAAIAALADRVDGTFGATVRLLYGVEGHLVVAGIGKSGLIGKKLAATLASTGTPSFFVHAAEAFHGDLGMITEHDAVLLISYSGETEEVIRLLPHLKNRGVVTVALAGDPNSTLAKHVDCFLDVSVDREICPNNLAPTSSTLATLAMGDALAVSLSRLRGFHSEDFARLHPGGSLGRRLLSKVRDVIDRPPILTLSAKARDCVFELAKGRHHMALVMDGERLLGVVSERELRPALEGPGADLDMPVSDLMNRRPAAVDPEMRVADAELEMRRLGTDALVVMDAGHVCGIITSDVDR